MSWDRKENSTLLRVQVGWGGKRWWATMCWGYKAMRRRNEVASGMGETDG